MKFKIVKSAIISAAAICAAATLGAAGCSLFGGGDKGHRHDMLQYNYLAPTCTQEGHIGYYKCMSCDRVFTDEKGTDEIYESDIVLPATGHTPVKIDGRPATCTADGITDSYKCSVCDTYTVEYQTIPKIPHVDDDGDCACDKCSAPAHHYDEWIVDKEVTCSEDGARHATCSVCGNATSETVKSTGHKIEVIPAKAATCTESGYTESRACIVCGFEITHAQIIPASAHKYSGDTCTVCGERRATKNLSYTEIKDKNNKVVAYSVSKGSATDKNIIIPSTYNGLPVTEILPYAFGYKYGERNLYIESIQIGVNVTKIDDNAFYGAEKLTTVSFANGSKLKEIGEAAFAGCDLLEDLTLPEGVEKLGDSAFKNCTSLTSFTLPQKVKNVGNELLRSCTSLTEFTYDCTNCTTLGTDMLTGCNKLSTINYNAATANLAAGNNLFGAAGASATLKLKIGAGVKSIPANAFTSLVNLQRAEFENGSVCTSIGAGAFKSLAKLSTVNLEDTAMQSIGDEAFYGNSLLGGVIFPATLTAIGTSAFENCAAISEITLTPALTSIGHKAFKQTTALTKINYNIEGTLTSPLASFENDKYTLKTTLNIGKEVTAIPANLFAGSKVNTIQYATDGKLTRIGSRAFANSSLESSLFPDTLEYIESYAFSGTKLSLALLGANIKSVGTHAFENCSQLAYIRLMTPSLNAASEVFYQAGATAGITVYIGEDVTTIPANLFAGSENVASRVKTIQYLGTSKLASIGAGAFRYSNISSISLPESVKSLGNYAFANCNNVTAIDIYATELNDLPEDNFVFEKSGEGASGITVTIKAGVRKVPENLFKNNAYVVNGTNKTAKIKSVWLENSALEAIGDGAFARCNSITETHITDIAAWCATSINEANALPITFSRNLYLNSSSLISLTIPDGVTEIKQHVFAYAVNIVSVTLPASLTKVGTDAFKYCTGITGVYIKNLTSFIGVDFESDAANPLTLAHNVYINNTLTSALVIPEGVTAIKKFAFMRTGSYSFESISLPSTLESIGTNAFKGNNLITTITLPSTLKTVGRDAFDGASSLTEMRVASLNDLLSISFASKKSNPLYAAGNLYINSVKVTDLSIPEGVTQIPNSAFAGLKADSLSLPTTLTSIGDFAFAGMHFSEAATLQIPAGVTHIGKSAFAESANLESVTFAANSTCSTIDAEAFYWCTDLKDIYIPASVTTMAEQVFVGCTYELIIRCAALSAPAGWHWNWNPSSARVYWNQ